jgi:GT2 family glycosyltransferase
MSDVIAFQLIPNEQIERVADGGVGHWEAIGNSGSFDCIAPGSFPLAGGWYRFSSRVITRGGELVGPVFYPDYGFGAIEGARVPLPFIPETGGSCLLRFGSNVQSLRFKPSLAVSQFELDDVRLQRVGRGGAFADMFKSLFERAPGKRARLSLIKHALQRFVSGGPRSLGDWLYAAYSGADQVEPADTYAEWIKFYDRDGAAQRRSIELRIAALKHRPLISIVMPVYNTDRMWLRACIESVRAQHYPHWELCIADDASPAPHVKAVLDEYMARDPRIRVAYRPQNGHISAASNTALELAKGEFVALLDHDDELHPNALLAVAEAVNEHPSWRMMFSDEDKVDTRGRRYEPYFKPDFNYDLFLGQNCVSHLGIYSTQLLRDVGGFLLGMEGSQDWDLALRCVERLSRDEIGHIPQVLYHWRAIPGSTALSGDQKSYAHDAGYKAVTAHLARVSPGATVVPVMGLPGNYRVRYPVPSPEPRVSLIVPTRDRLHLLKMCVDSILAKTDYKNFEILIVDNGSVEVETLGYFREVVSDDRVRVLSYPHPFNYSAINNFAAANTDAEIVGLVNNDIEAISPGWLSEMVSQAVRANVGCVGALLYYPNDTVQHAGVVTGFGGVAGHGHHAHPRGGLGYFGRLALVQEYSAVTAACLLVRRSIFEEVGGLDESLQVAFNDVDFCLRVRAAGYRNLWTPFAALYHHESASRGTEDTPAKVARFESEIRFMRERWGDSLDADPAYNPNLSLNTTPFALAFPPRETDGGAPVTVTR